MEFVMQLVEEENETRKKTNNEHENFLLVEKHKPWEHTQFVVFNEMEISVRKEVRDKHEVEIATWKTLALEHLVKVVMYDQMVQNQGEAFFVVLNKTQLYINGVIVLPKGVRYGHEVQRCTCTHSKVGRIQGSRDRRRGGGGS